MQLVVCTPADRPALWAACGLRQRGATALELVSVEALVCAPHWEHRLAADGTTRTIVRLADGRTIDSAAVSGVLNRVAAVPDTHLAGASAADREYARQEWWALLLGWLASLQGVINRPAPFALAGPAYPEAHWRWLAAAAGLHPHPDFVDGRLAPDPGRLRAIVLDDRTFGPPLPRAVARGAVDLARSAGARLLGVDFADDREGLRFARATALPDLTLGGDALLAGLSSALEAT